MSTPIVDTMIYRHNNGDTIPALGFGTWQLNGSECRRALGCALETGYRHIDTAQAYENEAEVGESLATSGIPRDKIFLTTKIWFSHLDEQGLKDSFQKSLEKLKTDYVDLLLIHWYSKQTPVSETLAAMNDLLVNGQVKQVGVSNFTVPKLEEAVNASDSHLFANQIEFHPFLTQEPIRNWCLANDVLLTAYSPLARGKVMENGVLKALAESYGKTPIQITLRWMMQQPKLVAIPKSATPEHIKANFDIFDFNLTPEEMKQIDGLNRGERLINPDFAPDWSES